MRTESMLDGEAEALAADARGLNIEDDQNAGTDQQDAVPDIEDAAEEGEKEVDEDNDAAEAEDSEEEHEATDKEDDDRKQRSNPLQMNGHEGGEQTDDEPSNDIEIDASEAEAASETDTVPEAEGTQPQIEDNAEEDNTASVAGEQDATTSGDPTTEISTGAAQSSKTPQNPPKAKQPQAKNMPNTKAAKRRAAKYALQDEEDKALAMSLLGSTKAEQRKAAEEEAKAAREAKLESDRARRRAQHNKAAEAEKARQEKLAKRAEKEQDGAAIVDDDSDDDNAETAAQERAEHMNIDRVVPAPEAGDELLAAIPVVAPWTALSRAKYKVKLQPGNVKKGKALREVIGIWSGLGNKGPKVVDEKNLDKERVWAREVELIKAWRVEEVVGVLPVKGVRVVQGGGIAGQTGAATGGGKGKSTGSARGGKGGKKGR